MPGMVSPQPHLPGEQLRPAWRAAVLAWRRTFKEARHPSPAYEAAFAAFREVGLDDAEAVHNVAQRFRETVLGLGGSMPAVEVYRLFRGRDATPDALLHDQGLLA